jgi:hypothetical protein
MSKNNVDPEKYLIRRGDDMYIHPIGFVGFAIGIAFIISIVIIVAKTLV